MVSDSYGTIRVDKERLFVVLPKTKMDNDRTSIYHMHILSHNCISLCQIVIIGRYIMEPLTPAQIENIFKEIDADHDGLVSRQDLASTDYALSLFDNSPEALNAFDSFHNGKMNQQDFTLLCHAARYKLYDFAIAKFNAEKYLNKYLLVSAPGEAAPCLKQSFLRLKAHSSESPNPTLHSIGVEAGVDKPHQQAKIEEIKEALGHPPHEVFFMLKLKVKNNGEELANKLHQTANMLLELVQGLAPEFEELLKGFKVYAKYGKGYVYLIVEVDNPLADGIISFAAQVLESISPECALKLKAKISSNLSNLLSEDFDYSKSGGEVLLEFDIDHVTLKKLKQIMGDNVDEFSQETPLHQIYSLLFEELKVEAEFNNLGEALSSALKIDISQLPKPAENLAVIKEMNIKENMQQFNEGGPDLISMLNQNGEAEGELSFNMHDFFVKFTFDMHIANAFDILG